VSNRSYLCHSILIDDKLESSVECVDPQCSDKLWNVNADDSVHGFPNQTKVFKTLRPEKVHRSAEDWPELESEDAVVLLSDQLLITIHRELQNSIITNSRYIGQLAQASIYSQNE